MVKILTSLLAGSLALGLTAAVLDPQPPRVERRDLNGDGIMDVVLYRNRQGALEACDARDSEGGMLRTGVLVVDYWGEICATENSYLDPSLVKYWIIEKQYRR